MNFLHALTAHGEATAPADASLEACDEVEALDDSARYCPTTLLASFALLMAGRGRCVNTDMMLGDREYAMWQLACARATDDPELAVLTARLFSYFDDSQHTGMAVMGTA